MLSGMWKAAAKTTVMGHSIAKDQGKDKHRFISK